LFADNLARERALALKVALPHLKFLDGDHRGYLILDVTRERLQANWYLIPSVLERSTAETRAASLVCERGSAHLVPA
jgi:alkaline phosphatase D